MNIYFVLLFSFFLYLLFIFYHKKFYFINKKYKCKVIHTNVITIKLTLISIFILKYLK